MKRGFFSRFSRSEGAETRPTEPATATDKSPESIAEIVREIARLELPTGPRKAAVSLRLDAEVLDWFRSQGPGYQTRINAILKAYKDAAG